MAERIRKVDEQIEDVARQIVMPGLDAAMHLNLVKRKEGLRREVQKHLLGLEILEKEELLSKLRGSAGETPEEG